MSQDTINTKDLIALTNEAATLATRELVAAFNKVATPAQKRQMKTYVADGEALKQEARLNPRLQDSYNRLRCLNVIERMDYGMSVMLANKVDGQLAQQILGRAKQLEGRRNISNNQRANLIEQAGGRRIASILRHAI